jgi:hypothetical protein
MKQNYGPIYQNTIDEDEYYGRTLLRSVSGRTGPRHVAVTLGRCTTKAAGIERPTEGSKLEQVVPASTA